MKKIVKYIGIGSSLASGVFVAISISACDREKSETEIMWEKYDANEKQADIPSKNLKEYKAEWKKEASDVAVLKKMIEYTIYSFILANNYEVFMGYTIGDTSIYKLCSDNKLNLLFTSSLNDISKQANGIYTIHYVGKLSVVVLAQIDLYSTNGAPHETLKKGDQMGFTFSFNDATFDPDSNITASTRGGYFHENIDLARGNLFGISEIIQDNTLWGMSGIYYVGTASYPPPTDPVRTYLNCKLA